MVRRLYDWVLHWAHTPYGMPALLVLTFAESSFFPIPPDPLLVALCIAAPRRSFFFAAAATAGSVMGGVAGYWIGAGGWHIAQDFFFTYVPGVSPEAFGRVQSLYDRWDFWAIFLAGLTPIPYKVFTLSAGVFRINFPIFVIASVLSRGLRFFVVAALIHRYGAPISDFIDRHFNRLTIAFGALVVLGFMVIQFVL
ncbi:MAG: DedA family protein [Gemmatimonadetes bacterium]|nr:DedA family protein [Gemmatimonadota bacterium]